jgi:hypothetical protein
MLRLQSLPILFAVLALASCSGGGDDGSGSPDGSFPNSAANITSANATSYANAVALAARMAATMHIGPILNNTATPGTYQDLGCVGVGGGPATLTVNPATGPVTGTLTYSAFDRCFGMRLAGTASVIGNLSGTQVQNANLTFTNLTFTAGTQTFQMSGTAALQWIAVGSPTIYGLTLNATVSGGSSFRLDNFRVDSTVNAGQELLAITGRLTMVDGFVDVAPGTATVELPAPGTGLQNGSVRMTGATTIATVFYNPPPAAPNITIVPR